MTVSITGLTFAQTSGSTANDSYIRFVGTGSFTAADFIITPHDGLNFSPSKVVVTNITDGTSSVWFLHNTALTVSGYTADIDGTRTAVAIGSAGVSYSSGSLTVDVSACAPITNDDDFVIECYR